jgi:hypothetical protein
MMRIGYARVSTQEQGHSGLGLDAQRDATGAVDEMHEEIASGAKTDRPVLAGVLSKLSLLLLLLHHRRRLRLRRLRHSCDASSPTSRGTRLHELAAYSRQGAVRWAASLGVLTEGEEKAA